MSLCWTTNQWWQNNILILVIHYLLYRVPLHTERELQFKKNIFDLVAHTAYQTVPTSGEILASPQSTRASCP